MRCGNDIERATCISCYYNNNKNFNAYLKWLQRQQVIN